MFCQNCGKVVDQGAKFCKNCGTPVEASEAARPAAKPKAASHAASGKPEKQSKQKKKPNLLLILIVVGICFLIGRTMGGSMGESMSGGSSSGSQSAQSSNSGSQSTQSTDSGSELSGSNSAYEKIFSDRNIVTTPAFFGTLESAAYANVDSDGYIDHLQFGYEGDTIVQMVETVYMPVEGLSDTDKETLDAMCREAYPQAEALSFVTISYHMGYSYYSVTITMDDLNQVENIQSAVDAGFLTLTDGGASVMSMAASDASLLEQGYAKK